MNKINSFSSERKFGYEEVKRLLKIIYPFLIEDKNNNYDIFYLIEETGWNVDELLELSRKLDGIERKALNIILGPSKKDPFNGRVWKFEMPLNTIISTRFMYKKNNKLVEIPKEMLEKCYYYLLNKEIPVTPHFFNVILTRYKKNILPGDFENSMDLEKTLK